MYHEFMPIFLISNLVIHTDVSKFKYGIAVFLHLISFDFYICISFPQYWKSWFQGLRMCFILIQFRNNTVNITANKHTEKA